MALTIVVVCTLLLLIGLAMVIAWGTRPVRPPFRSEMPSAASVVPVTPATPPLGSEQVALAPSEVPPSEGAREAQVHAQVSALKRYLWWANVATVAALASGILVAGAGGRLVMRVLAATSPASAQGRLTEAQANVGFPTIEGSVALLVFAGLPAGFAVAFIYLLIHRWLPAGRWAGPLLGVLLLLVFGAAVEPFRADNIDFAIVGPGWLSVVLFSALAVFHGAVVAAVAGAFSERLPLPSEQNWKYYLPLLAAVLFLPAGLVLGVGALAVMVWAKAVPAVRSWRPGAGNGLSAVTPPSAARRGAVIDWAARGLLGGAAVAALPFFISAVTSIVSR